MGRRTSSTALEKYARADTRMVFTSSISTYGDTSGEEPPVRVGHSQSAIDIYADSKIEGEKLIVESSLSNAVSLRIAGILVPAFLEPPSPWPFMEDQRVEMVHRDDVADALFRVGVGARGRGQRYSTSLAAQPGSCTGATTSRTSSRSWARRLRWRSYRETPGWMDWYDTEESQRILGYQNRSYQHYIGEMQAIIQEMMEG